jgi:DNA-binding NarL/FixJ family response regulator
MLSLEDDVEVVGQAQDGREALALARETRPDVVVLDVDMPLMGGQAALRRLLVVPSPPRVVIVTVFADPALVRELLAHGASAYLSKNAPMRDLVSTVRAVARTAPSQHGPHRDNVIVSLPREMLGGWPGTPRPPSGLSSREAEVFCTLPRARATGRLARPSTSPRRPSSATSPTSTKSWASVPGERRRAGPWLRVGSPRRTWPENSRKAARVNEAGVAFLSLGHNAQTGPTPQRIARCLSPFANRAITVSLASAPFELGEKATGC